MGPPCSPLLKVLHFTWVSSLLISNLVMYLHAFRGRVISNLMAHAVWPTPERNGVDESAHTCNICAPTRSSCRNAGVHWLLQLNGLETHLQQINKPTNKVSLIDACCHCAVL
jgi:hypothetical protein